MRYNEIPAPAYFSKHIESYWEMCFQPGELHNRSGLFVPDCTFSIIFTDQPLRIKNQFNKTWKTIAPGAIFVGQRNSDISFLVKKAIRIYGIRFKPFAFATIIKTPIHLLNDQFLPLNQLFSLDISAEKQVQQIIKCQSLEQKTQWVNTLLLDLFEDSFFIDQTLREQLNYIMDRKGLIKVQALFSEFGISKVTLRKHFINKVGLTPKKVSRIWRMNYFLQLKEKDSGENLTSLCLESGFYDQAHFIKEFKSLFGPSPREFFQQNAQLLKISQEGISRRFTNQYDPRA